MRSLIAEKIAPLLALVVTAVLVFALALQPLYARGLPYSTSWKGALLHVPLAALLALAAWGVLVVWKKRTRAEVGLAWDDKFLMELPLAALVGMLWIGLAALALGATGASEVTLNTARPGPLAIASGFLAFLGSAAVQQLALLAWASALAPAARSTGRSTAALVRAGDAGASTSAAVHAGWPGWSAVLVPPALFALFHVEPTLFEGGAPAVVLIGNVFLVGVVCTLLFFRPMPPREAGLARSLAVPIGFHAGWNFAQTFIVGCALSGTTHTLGLLAWAPRADLPAALTGGAIGLEGSVVVTAALGVVCAALIRGRTLPPDGA